MKLHRLFVALIFLMASTAKAGIYNCTNGNSRPVEIKNEGKAKFILGKTPSIFPSVAEASVKNLENKTPFLIYYAIDSTEAFMQYSINFELASLQEGCKRNSNINFVGFINSLYTKKNQILVCKDRVVSYLNLSHYPDLDKKLKIKRKHISTADDHADPEKLGPMSYRSGHDKESNKPFGKYPLAHPDFLYDLIHFSMTEASLFPSEKYAPFLNLKSHGGKYNVLAGMHQCQEKAKELSANKMIEKILTKKEIQFLNKQDTYEKVALNLTTYESVLNKISLGNIEHFSSFTGASDQLGEFNMGEFNMSFTDSFLGDAIAGLGVDQGLGIEFAFGTGHPALNWVLHDLFEDDSDKTLGFLMLESCDTKRDPDLFHSYLTNIYGYYSAQHSLWYRNLNWWEMLEMAQGSSTKLVEILKTKTAQIPNLEVIKVK